MLKEPFFRILVVVFKPSYLLIFENPAANCIAPCKAESTGVRGSDVTSVTTSDCLEVFDSINLVN